MSNHAQLTTSDIHLPFAWIFADSTARLAETVTVDDISKICFQEDDSSVWVLTAVTTWVQIGSSASTLVVAGTGLASIIAGGASGVASGERSVALDGDNSVAMGKESATRLEGQFSGSSGSIDVEGDNQFSIYTLRRDVTHSDANWYDLFIDGGTQRLTIPANSVFTFIILVSGTTSGATKAFSYKVEGAIKNASGTTTLLAGVVSVIYEDDTDFALQVLGDDTNDALLIQVQDTTLGGDLVYWSATVFMSEVTQ